MIDHFHLTIKCIWAVRLHHLNLFATSSQTHQDCSVSPILTMRFALSLRRCVDYGDGQEWQSKHLPSINLGGPPRNVGVPVVYENIEMDPEIGRAHV